MKWQYDARRGNRHERGYTNRWTRAAKRYLRRYPNCRRCGQLATCVDHIQPHNGDQRLFWRESNWQSLCHACHNAKTAEDKTGKPRGCDESGIPPWWKGGGGGAV